MEECKSMYHGGELVSALDCDFESYRELGLLCPFCNEPVYLCGETVRQSSRTHKLSYIRPHFKHFPGGDPLDFDCEKRAISAEGKRYLDAIRAERRGQRLELFNRYLWDMIRDGMDMDSSLDSFRRQKILGHSEVATIEYHVLQFIKEIECQDWTLASFVSAYVEQILGIEGTSPKRFAYNNDNEENENQWISSLRRSRVDGKVQLLICLEVADAIRAKNLKRVLRELICKSVAWHFAQEFRGGAFGLEERAIMQVRTLSGGRSNVYGSTIVLHIVKMICLTPWQQQIEEKSKLLRTDTAGRGFAKAR
jgi:hypothetical protein